jgi:alpha-tubulin suppressor-like RCC1 family protein
MKFPSGDNRSAVSVRRLSLALAMVALVPLLLFGSAPSWWSQRDVLVEDALPDDYAPVNQGQLKNIAKAAVEEMDARLTGGAGEPLHTPISSWSPSAPETNDYAPVNLGQLKNVARLFYDRLIAAGIADHYPWLGSPSSADDFAVANIGQVKHLFSFEVPAPNVLDNPLGDRLAAGHESANLALQAHTVWIWGDHLSTGNAGSYPRRLQGVSAISSVSTGERHLVLLGRDGAVWTWGENTHGQLGDSTRDKHYSPVAVPNLINVAAVKAGGRHTLALKNDGTVVAWGDNDYGQLGTGSTTDSSIPELVTGLSDVRKITAGYQRSMAIKNDGTLWIWGYDHYAWQTAQDLFNTIPVIVAALTDVVDVAAGYEHNVAVKADGSVWTWGSNYANQIGDGSSTSKFHDAPVQVANLANITKVASSYDHTLALASDGTVWAWGENSAGQLGDGTTQSRGVPVQVSGLNGVVALATAYSYSLAMKGDGTVWAWGNGALGVMPGVDKRLPQLVNLGISDANDNGMDDRWELHYLGGLGHSSDADFDEDGVSNLQEFVRGSDPSDYFNGATPIIQIAGGNNQIGDPAAFLAKPLTVRVQNSLGQLLTNAPVNFAIAGGSGSLAPAAGAPKQQALLVRTDVKGEAMAYHALPQAAGTSTRTTARAGKSGSLSSVTFRSIAKYSLPPTPTPPPPSPGSTPTPTPNITPTPAVPYRYAIIDLGKDLSPRKIANNGAVLLSGTGSNQGGYFRWKGGVLEQLTYAGDYYNVEAADMNDNGVAVGVLSQQGQWINNAENEIEAGLKWTADSSVPLKISAPLSVPNRPQPGSARQARFTAINNKNEIYGQVRTGLVVGGINFNYTPVLNAYYWPENLGLPTALSFASARMDPSHAERSLWEGSSDTILRASSSGHYIGRKFTPSQTMLGSLQGTVSGMIDGETVPFWPKDINETGIVVGDTPDAKSMVLRTLAPVTSPSGVPPPSTPDTIFQDVSPIAINTHERPVTSPAPQTAPGSTASPTPIPVPQILAWAGNALVLWERQEAGKTWHPFGLEEMIPTMEGWEFLRPQDMNDSGAIVGQGWYTDPSNPRAERENHAFLLVPAELMVDANRDGQMSFDDLTIRAADRTSDEKPYRFWLNDDHDEERTVDGGDQEQDDYEGPPDFNNPALMCGRDLEDWSRLWISFKGIVGLVKSPGVTFELGWKPSSGASAWSASDGQPGVKVMVHDSQAGAGVTEATYLSDKRAADTQAHGIWGGVIKPVNPIAGYVLPNDFLQFVTEESPYLHLLFEGWTRGKGQLVIKIKKDGGTIGEYPPIDLALEDVKNMYETYSVGDVEQGNMSVLSPVDYNYWPKDRPTLTPLPSGEPFSPPPDETDTYILWVHGWNMSPFDKESFADTAFKRLFWQGYKGRFGTFRWPTFFFGGDVPPAHHFDASEHRAWASSLGLLSLLNDLNGGRFKGNIRMMAHSMGNVVASEALRRSNSGQMVHTFIASQAAISAHCYDVRAPAMQYGSGLGPTTPNVYGYYSASVATSQPHEWATEGNPSYLHSNYLAGKAGRYFNYYNEDDWALTWPRWQLDQQTKPDADYGYEHAGLGASRGFWRDRGFGATWLTFPTDRHEIFAWAAESRSYALGAQWVAGAVDRNVDLKGPPFGYGQPHKFHSGQFRGTNMERRHYWEKFLVDCGLKEPQ